MPIFLVIALVIGVILAIMFTAWLISSVVGLVFMLLLAGLIGVLAQKLVGYKGGFLFSIGAGLIGAVAGTILANVLGVAKGPELFNLPLLWTVVGSLGVAAVAKVAMPRQRGRLSASDRRLLS